MSRFPPGLSDQIVENARHVEASFADEEIEREVLAADVHRRLSPLDWLFLGVLAIASASGTAFLIWMM